MNQPLVLDIDQVAELLRCKPDTVRAACRAGELPGIKWGEDWTIPAGALAARLDEKALEEAAKRRQPAQPSATLVSIDGGDRRSNRRRPPVLPELPQLR